MYSAPFPCYLVPLRRKYLTAHPIIEPPQPMFLPQLRDQALHPYKLAGKIIVLYILILKFLGTKLEDRRSASNYSTLPYFKLLFFL